MASVALGRHPAQLHLDTEQQRFLQQLSSGERKKLLRKSSGEMKAKKSAPAEQGLAAAAASPAPLHPQGNSAAPEDGYSSRGGGVVSPALQPCRVDNVDTTGMNDLSTCCRSGEGREPFSLPAKRKNSIPRAEGEDVKPPGSPDRSDAGTSSSAACSHHGSGRKKSLKEVKAFRTNSSPANGHVGFHRPVSRRSSQVTLHQNIDLSAWGDGTGFGGPGAGHKMPVLTQCRSGVVKMLRQDPPRKEAWSIFRQQDPRVKEEKGEGHVFTPGKVARDWCDACNRQVRAEALKCKNCSYTCHLECQGLVQLDCNQQDRQEEDTPSQESPGPERRARNASKEEEEKPKALSEEEIRSKIEDYNSKVSECVGMKLGEDKTYTGFVKVHLKLRRPVTVCSAGGGAGTADSSDQKTSFYLPLDAVKQLHISSTTTVSEVIQGLLKKFMVLDNPRKFALYRQTHRDGQDLFQKLPVTENPLYLRLLAGPDPNQLTFVLKENETNEVEWHAFSVPELQNFLAILEKEERDRVKQVRQKYELYKQKLKQALQEAQGKPG
ncbi:ras association domain-containing protein 5 [Lepisosteus oculatus]|uniref:ras association domain-containing protein 5 n=1 Tax=Lepisosteus oculatus TaxID=7918 RepID=UPI00371CDA96